MADPAWDWVWNILGINNHIARPPQAATQGQGGVGTLAPGSSTTRVTLPLVMAGAAPAQPQLNALGNPANRSSWFDYESAFKGGWPKNVTGGTAPGSYDYRAMQQAGLIPTPPEMVNTPWGEMTRADYDEFMATYGDYDMYGGFGGGADNSLGYAQLAQQQEEFAARMALEQQALAQQAELARLQREEQRRQVAMQIGQAMNELTARNWETGLPWTLPKGTQYAPGAEPGGALAGIAKAANVGYTPQRLAVSNPPSRETMEQWLNDALAAWGR